MVSLRGAAGLTLICLLVTLVGAVQAQEEESPDKLRQARYSMVGVRMGVWADQGDGSVIDENIDFDMSSAGFFTEFFYDHRFTPAIMAELSFGVASRGEAVIRNGDDEYIGTINLYPLLVQVKLSPLVGLSRTIHPFIIGGGGFVFGRHNTEIIRSVDMFYDQYFAERTQTDIIAVFGGGVDVAISEQFGFTAAAKYYPISFGGDGLAGVSDYSGVSVSVGLAYYLHKK